MEKITDKYIIDFFSNKHNNINSNLIKHYKTIDKHTNLPIRNYLLTRFPDTTNINEILYRIFNHIECCPICKECGKPIEFKYNTYKQFCCVKCSNSNKEKQLKEKNTKLIIYGDANYNNREQAVSHTNYDIIQEKIKNTCIKKYGVSNVFGNSLIKEKIKQTCINKYGVDNVSKLKEIKDKKTISCLNNHNVLYGFHTPQAKQNQKNIYTANKDIIIQKIKNTKIIKYNDENYTNHERAKQTCLSKYGVINPYNITQIQYKANVLSHSDEANTKRILTFIKKYKCNIPKKLSDITFSDIMLSQEYQQHINLIKKLNNSFNTSKPEEQYYLILKEKYPDIIRQYRDERYPFNCDFYIPSLNLFIECNFHWTHGGKPFEGTDEDLQKLQDWCDKNTEYYDNAIDTWCIRDVKKRKIAKQNKLNYIELWNI